MNRKWTATIGAAMLAVALGGGSAVFGQGSPDKPTLDKNKPAQPGTPAPTLSLNGPAVNPEEEAAFKAFQAVPLADAAKTAQTGEEFLQKYPESQFRAAVYSTLTRAYYGIGNAQKMAEAGAKAVEMSPNDVQLLAILGQTIPRALSKDPTAAMKQLSQAELYAKRAIELTPTLPKPEALTDEAFAGAKNVVLGMAHGGLGLVYIHRGKFSEAAAELNESVKVDPQPDPVNFYLLGIADERTSHFDDAAAAFAKCAAINGQMQAECKASIERAKKSAATQLSAPK